MYHDFLALQIEELFDFLKYTYAERRYLKMGAKLCEILLQARFGIKMMS